MGGYGLGTEKNPTKHEGKHLLCLMLHSNDLHGTVHILLDVDECALGTDNCHQWCVNTEGGACSRGFSSTGDGINCAR